MTMWEVGDSPTGARVFVPADPGPRGDRPLVLFLHGYQALSVGYYENWMLHLARRGHVVIAPHWQTRTTLPWDFTDNAAKGLQSGLDELAARGVGISREGVVFFGHSGGGTLALNLAARAGRGELPVRPSAIMTAAPGRCLFCDQLTGFGIPMEAMDDVPADISLVVMASEDDRDVGTRLARFIMDSLEQVPGSRKAYLVLRSDDHGDPPLRADHRVAAARTESGTWGTDALDWFGTWKVLDALVGCVREGQWCHVALGPSEEQRFMGTWSDGVPVVPMALEP
jgi:pimeloyl-ACP methyl ester carboxylesterase